MSLLSTPSFFCDSVSITLSMESDALLQLVREMQSSLKNLENHITSCESNSRTIEHSASHTPARADETASVQDGSQESATRQTNVQDGVASSSPAEEPDLWVAPRTPTQHPILYAPHDHFLGSQVRNRHTLLGSTISRGLMNLLLMSLEDIDVDEETITQATAEGKRLPKLTSRTDWKYCEQGILH